MEFKINLKETLYKHLEKMPMDEFQLYLDEVELGYIRMNQHPEDSNIVILNYTELATFERRWNEQTLASRGLILDLTDENLNGIIYILAKPFGKFFNYSENPEYESDIDFTKIKTVMEKVDGSLGISYFFKDEIRFATRGSFNSEQAIKATQIWKKYSDRFFNLNGYLLAPYTLLVEIIYPENRIVVDYKGQEDLVLLGMISIAKGFCGVEYSYETIVHFASFHKMPYAKQHNLLIDEMIMLQDIISANEEGWVIRFQNDKRLKIKGKEYMEIHRVMYGLSDKAKVKAWSEGKLAELLLRIPEEFREEIETMDKQLTKLENDYLEFILPILEHLKKNTNSKKEYAMNVNGMQNSYHRKLLFNAYDTGVINKELIRDYIYKNYPYFLSKIREVKENE